MIILLFLSVQVIIIAAAPVEKKDKIPTFLNGRPEDGFVPKPPKNAAMSGSVKSLWFNQKLDHVGSNPGSWNQLYETNDQYYRPGGPLFVLISGEVRMDYAWMSYGDWVKNAKIYGAYLLQLEHRYYGDSHPTTNTSTASLKYLSVDQALGDLAGFITAMKTKLNMEKSKVIVFGGSYAGNLAAWFRLKYPHIADGAVASSAPVKAKADFFEYLEVVGKSLDYVSPGCSAEVKSAFASLQSTVSNNPEKINQIFNLCSHLDTYNPNNLATFYQSIISPFMTAVQYNRMGPYSEVGSICSTMQGKTGTPLDRLATLITNRLDCVFIYYPGVVQSYSETTWESYYVSAGVRQWFYQTCTQFGYYQTTDASDQPFGTGEMSLKYNEQLCMDVFGIDTKSISNAIQETNSEFGSTNLMSSNTVLPNGSVDPWHALGILTTNSQTPTDLAEFYVGGSHCYDMLTSDSYDSQALINVRMEITAQIRKFLG